MTTFVIKRSFDDRRRHRPGTLVTDRLQGVRHVGWRYSVDTLVYQHGEFVFYSPRCPQPQPL